MDNTSGEGITRRQVLAAALGGAAAAGLATEADADGKTRSAQKRMPVVYLPHGGGPWPFVSVGLFSRRDEESLAGYLRGVGAGLKPKAVLAVSAHWEAPVPTVMSAPRPPMFYDYYGFPPESYTITWPAPGDPRLAARTRELLGAAGWKTADDPRRGFDHGTFVPLKLTFPDAEVPTVQLSLKAGLDPAEHLAMGRALAPLRDEGVLIVGSGMSYHNMRGLLQGGGLADSEAFDAWLVESAAAAPEARHERLARWTLAPAARRCHPREEHLLPLMVVAGAAGEDRGRLAYNDVFGGVRLSAFHFGG